MGDTGQLKNKVVYFKNLDILRFLAVMMVLIAHAYEGWCGWFGKKPGVLTVAGNHNDFTFFGNWVNTAFLNGGFGVDLFFLISGFLITYLLVVEKKISGKISIWKFYIRRILRIWPAYFLLLALAPLAVKLVNASQPDYFPNLFFYNNSHAISIKFWQYPFAHLWSICVEEHFYLIWPLIVSIIPTKRIKLSILLLIIGSVLFRCVLQFNHAEFWSFYLNTFARIDVLLIGALFAVHYKEHGFNLFLSKSMRVVIYSLFILFYFADSIYSYTGLFDVTLKKYFYVLVSGFAMCNFIFNPEPLFKLPFLNILNYLGKISFSIYLFSNVLIPIIVVKCMYKWGIDNFYLFIFLNILFSILVSIIVFELVEKQVLKFKGRFAVIDTSR
jgi:peptidoglycan/LPS O-acetylase OafA/YrhL